MTSFFERAENKVLTSVQRLLTFNERIPYELRESAYRGLCAGRRWTLGRPELETARADLVASLARDGYAKHLRDLSPAEVAELHSELAGMKPILFDYGEGRRDKTVFTNADLAASYPFLKLATDDEIIRIAASYLGGPPLIQVLTVWDIDRESAQQTEMFYHVDYHGHRSLKLFFYLSDVSTEGSGHHEYVAGSHVEPRFDRLIAEHDNDRHYLRTQIESKRRYQGSFLLNTDVIDRFLADQRVKFFGPAGLSFIEDARGLHRGTPITNDTRRRVFKVLYTAIFSPKDRGEPARDTRAFERRLSETSLDPRIFRRLCSKIIA